MSGYLVRNGRVCVDLPFGASYLGRSGECRVRLEEGLVSRRHARLDVEVDAVYIEDLGSVNGTYVNGELLTGRRRLGPGDVVGIGSEELVLEQADAYRARQRKTPASSVAPSTPQFQEKLCPWPSRFSSPFASLCFRS